MTFVTFVLIGLFSRALLRRLLLDLGHSVADADFGDVLADLFRSRTRIAGEPVVDARRCIRILRTSTTAATARAGDPRAHTDATQATRVLDLRRTVLHTDGQATPLPDTVALVDLAHTAAGWRVTGYHLVTG